MTSAQRQQGRRLVLLAILVVAILLAVALAAIGPSLFSEISASYNAPVYLPEQAEYCPGDLLRAVYEIQRRQPGPVEVIGAWCTAANTCLLADSTVRYGIVFAPSATVTATLSLTIPVNARMTPGSEWVYARTVRNVGGHEFSLFAVPFVIRAGCN